jgi:arabinofuranosyltransferase
MATVFAPREPARPDRLIPAFLVTFFSIVVIRSAWLGDDAYITLRTVDNLVNGYGLRWNVAERVQVFTHPLWMMLVAAAYVVTREPYYTVLALSIALSIAAAVFVSRIGGDRAAAVWAVTALVCSKAYIDYSTSGLENPLTHVLLIAFWMAWRWSDRDRGAAWMWLAAGLLCLNRFDLILLILPALATRLSDVRDRTKSVVIGMSFPAVWSLFALWYYGTILPNTAYAKLETSVSHRELAAQGALYLLNSISLDPSTLLVVLVALLVSLRSPRREWLLPVGLALYVGYIVVIGGDFMSGRLLSPVLLGAVLQILSVRRERTVTWMAATAITLLVGMTAARSPLLTQARTSIPLEVLIEPTGIVDERMMYYEQGLGLLLTNRGETPRHPWIKLGMDARSGPHVITGVTIGMIGYYAGPAIHIVDVLALTDPLLARLPADPGWHIGHFTRTVPEGYLETLQSGRNMIRDAQLAMLYEKIQLITRGPLWSAKRLRAIVEMNIGMYDGWRHAASASMR